MHATTSRSATAIAAGVKRFATSPNWVVARDPLLMLVGITIVICLTIGPPPVFGDDGKNRCSTCSECCAIAATTTECDAPRRTAPTASSVRTYRCRANPSRISSVGVGVGKDSQHTRGGTES
jgi:hypothetical protein